MFGIILSLIYLFYNRNNRRYEDMKIIFFNIFNFTLMKTPIGRGPRGASFISIFFRRGWDMKEWTGEDSLAEKWECLQARRVVGGWWEGGREEHVQRGWLFFGSWGQGGSSGFLAGKKTEEMRRRERYDIYHGSWTHLMYMISLFFS